MFNILLGIFFILLGLQILLSMIFGWDIKLVGPALKMSLAIILIYLGLQHLLSGSIKKKICREYIITENL